MKPAGGTGPDYLTSIAEQIAAHPGLALRLFSVHLDDGTGHCRVCSAGPQAGHQVWPCRLRDIARAALAVRTRS